MGSRLPYPRHRVHGGVELGQLVADNIGPELQARLDRALDGQDEARHLKIGELEVGDWGVIRAHVSHLHPPRAFQRKRGGEGTVGRVALADGSGEVDMVLWDTELQATRDLLQPGTEVILRGATVKAGWKGGLELGLGSAVIEAAPTATELTTIAGEILSIGDTEPIEGRFRADVQLKTEAGEVWVVVWDDAVKEARDAGVGATWTIPAKKHPVLDDWFIA